MCSLRLNSPGRAKGAFYLPVIIPLILVGSLLLSLLFYLSWQRLNQQVVQILKQQFNRQQLELAQKIADNVESYFDFLENDMLGYAGLFQTSSPGTRGLEAALAERFMRHKQFGILGLCRFNPEGKLVQAFSSDTQAPPPGSLTLPREYLNWVRDPAHRGRLLLSKTSRSDAPPWQGRLVMRFLTPLYWPGATPHLAGALELIIDPFFICQKVTQGVRSGETGYAWIIDQDQIFLAHYEKDFVGHDSIQVRKARNPKIVFRGLRELDERLLAGQEGTTEYDSGWHRQKVGLMPKLAAYTPVRFDKGLIRGVTQVEDPAHNLWGVCVVAPVEEVYGNVGQVLHQALFLVGLFLLMVLVASGGFIGVALTWNRSLGREVELKTRELLESQERLVRSERFAAVGEAASYVSHEIKNPLMVIGGLAQQVERHLEDQSSKEKLQIIQTEVKRLENFLGDLRDFLRPLPPVKQAIDLNQVIEEVETLMADNARQKGVTLACRRAPRLPQVEVDPNQIKQVLLNLIKNSLEAMDSGGQIILASGADPHQVWFSIQDTGPGMSEEVLEKIFNPFFTTKETGTGLGLAVIHKIITDHHGSIGVESAPGKGAKFLVRLPCSA
jgi:two-component system sensor histidine kinase HydH